MLEARDKAGVELLSAEESEAMHKRMREDRSEEMRCEESECAQAYLERQQVSNTGLEPVD